MVLDALAGPPAVMIHTWSKTWSEPTTDRNSQILIVGPSSGSVMRHVACQPLAPSRAAASRSSWGMPCIPGELREAAALDGASGWQATWRITLPLLGPTIRIWLFLSVVGSLQVFDQVWIMTGGGPANASSTMATYLVQHGFQSYEFGYGSAVAVIIFLICFIFALLYQRFVLRRDTRGALTRAVG